jgi:hypothetical protein
MKKVFSLLLVAFCFGFQAQTESACVIIPKSISINQEDNWSKIFDSSCVFKQELNFVLYNRWGNKLCEVKSLNEFKQFSIFKKDNSGQRVIPAGTCFWTLEYTIEGENQPRKSNGYINILD